MTEVWEEMFKSKKEMWGINPALSSELVNSLFVENNVKTILIPGIGYGRNAQLFIKNGMSVTGIEISKTAIQLAKKNLGSEVVIHHGSVTEMPFDQTKFDGIYCYALIHLLDKSERIKFINDCYNKLKTGGLMVFATVTKEASVYRQGKYIEKDRYELFDGVKFFFYDQKTIHEDFENVGLFEIEEVDDVFPFYLIKCIKKTY